MRANTIPFRVTETDVEDIGECPTEPMIRIAHKEEAAPATLRFGTPTANEAP